jgi:small subunit ribosomal protein S17
MTGNTHTDLIKKRTLTGEVISNKMQDTVVVLVKDYKQHPKYRKYFLRGKRYKAQDKGNTASIGDKVVIEECRPVSKEKKFIIVKNLTK